MMNSASKNIKKQDRLEARVTVSQKKLIERAASIKGTSVTDFIVTTMQQVSLEAIRDYETVCLQDEDREIFINALLKPQSPNSALKAAANRYKKSFQENA